MANASSSQFQPDPADALQPQFRQQAKALRGLIQTASVQRPLAAARAAPGRLKAILDALGHQGPVDPNIDRTTSELLAAIEALDSAIYGPGTVGEDRNAKVADARATSDRKLEELIVRLLKA